MDLTISRFVEERKTSIVVNISLCILSEIASAYDAEKLDLCMPARE